MLVAEIEQTVQNKMADGRYRLAISQRRLALVQRSNFDASHAHYSDHVCALGAQKTGPACVLLYC